ncbi:MFS transporter, partial [Leucobacter sp. OLES1]
MTRARSLLPWAVWTVAALSYAVAIINRSSLAALGPAAQDHFGIDATTLSAFPVIQLIVYAGLQIPVGILLDRVGATTMILIGGALMIVGQVTMATVPDVGLAILARVLVGAGDACSFISVMRMLPEWFPARQLPTVSQLTGLVGQAGQLVSVTPLALMVSGFGWASGFLSVAAVGFLVTLLAALVLRDSPGTGTAFERMIGRTGGITRRSAAYRPQGSASSVEIAPPATGLIEMPQGRVRRGLGFWQRARRLLRLPGV